MPANLHVRNVPDDIVAKIKRRASENGRSAEAEHRAALEQAFGGMSKAEWFRRAAELRTSIEADNGGPLSPGSEVFIREDRDSR